MEVNVGSRYGRTIFLLATYRATPRPTASIFYIGKVLVEEESEKVCEKKGMKNKKKEKKKR